MTETPRTMTIGIDLNPSISGYGGFDRWTIETLTGAQRDAIVAGIDSFIVRFCKANKIDGGWDGST